MSAQRAAAPAGYRIRIVGLCGGGETEYDGLWLKAYDPTYVNPYRYDGGILETTRDPVQAAVFPSAAAAMEKWRECAPPPYHLSLDGKPNRPLTAFSVEVTAILQLIDTEEAL